MKKNTGNKKGLRFLFAAAFIMIMAMGTIALTGCGGGSGNEGGGQEAAEPEPIINPITGIEVESEDALPSRPIQVSIPNDTYGAVPQSNITQADIIYEMPVEGELTRLQAIYYGEIPEEFGPNRSIRYYFADLATEYKAASVGYGWGKHARDQMKSNNVHYLNGMDHPELWKRVDKKKAPNNAYIEWKDVEAFGNEHHWFDEKQVIEPWTFRNDKWTEEQEQAKADAQAVIDEKSESTEEADVQAVEKAKKIVEYVPEKATDLHVKALGCDSTCTWDAEKGKYLRYWYGDPYVDLETNEQLEFDNILVQKVHSDIMTDENGASDPKGRLTIDLYAGGEALLFTQGEVVKGTWSRDGADSRTVFKDELGRDFAFTPGKTWVYVLDQDKEFSYENNAPEETEDTEASEAAE